MNRKELKKELGFLLTKKQGLYNRALMKLQEYEEHSLLRANIIKETHYLPLTVDIKERLFHIFKEGYATIPCPICKQHNKFLSFAVGYRKYCSVGCQNKSKIGKPSGSLGIRKTEEQREAMSKRMKGNKYALGAVRDDEWRRKQKESRKDHVVTQERRDAISKALTGRPRSLESRRKQRLHYINKANEDLKKYGKVLSPRMNPKSFPYFKEINNNFGLEGIYGDNGKEYYDKDLGYWLDFIDFDCGIIIEWDEQHHYYNDGSLKKKDIDRQTLIEQKYYDFCFIRIKQEEFMELDEHNQFMYTKNKLENSLESLTEKLRNDRLEQERHIKGE